jgi:hypothetical protein
MRSPRFSRSAATRGGGLAYATQKSPLPSTDDEALLAFAPAGVKGFTLGHLTYHKGDLHAGSSAT